MAPPAPPHKIAWQWAEFTKPDEVQLNHIVNAYRINLNSCNSCRRNVKGNPNCLSGLGEKIWLNDSSLVCESELLREKDSYVGLKNLGATCYANAFLQLWFHMKEIRNAVFSWNKELYKEDQKENHSSVFEIIACLQEVFALLQFSKRKFIDPTILLNCLLLDNTVQQDAQEFSKLFMSKLEELPSNGGGIFHDFVGRYDYVTSCTSCGNQTRSRSEFYELDLNIVNNKHLSSCLEEFLQQEILEGDNQFFCSYCNSKQNATRFIELVQLPATLNLQLLRFVYDKEKHSKKKLSSRLTFPETLNMSSYVNNVKYKSGTTLSSSSSSSSPSQRDDLTYDLFAILIHRGQLASSGHYVAVIRDVQKGTACQFNDEKVTQLDEDLSGSDLDNASEEDNLSINNNNNNGSGKMKKIKPCKGEMSLANAYMLVYKRRDVAVSACEEIKFEDLSDELKKKVTQHNMELEQDMLEEKRKQEKVIQKKDAIKLLYSTVMSYEGSSAEDKLEKFEFIPTQNLVKFLRLDEIGPANKSTSTEESKKDSKDVPTTLANEDNGDNDTAGTAVNTDSHDDDEDGGDDSDGGKFYCKHKKLDPDDVVNFKLLPTDIVDNLADQLSLENRLRCSDVVCRDCVVERCRSMNAKMSLNEDNKKISSLMKSKNYKPQGGYLVGKESWKNWRKRAERNLLLEGSDEGSGDYSEGDNKEADYLSALESINDQLFNSDLLCTHNKLDPNEQNWKPVSIDVWQILKKYFNGCPEFLFGASCCEICENKSLQERLFLDESKQQAAQLKQLLNDLYLNRKRPQLSLLKKQQKYLNETSSNKLQPKQSDVQNSNEIDSTTNNSNNNCSELQQQHSTTHVNEDGAMVIADSPGRETSEVTDSFQCPEVVDDPVKPQPNETCHANQQLQQQQNLRYYLVSSMFIERWKKCYKDASRNEMPMSVCNNLLLCHHRKLLFDLWDFDAVSEVDKEYVLLWSEEWEILRSYICVDQEIYVELSCEVSSDPSYHVVSSPELCVECLEERQREVLESRYKYEKAKIYVCRLDGAEADAASAAATYQNSATTNSSLNNNNPTNKMVNSYNVEMQDKPYSDEKQRKRKLDEESSTIPGEKYQRLECCSAVRRSGRRSKSRAEKEVVVSSTMTLRQLNFEIFRLFQVYKTNQVLYMDGRELIGDDCTLEELCVPPEALIKLEVHEDSDENFIVNTTGGIEEGFKGTGLVG